MSTVNLPGRLLRAVAKPARYVGGEWNSISKDLPVDAGQLTRFAFCFPDTYEIGMSNQALRLLYSLLNERRDTWCERFFAPWTDMEQLMRQQGLPLFSIESRTPLNEFDLIGFTLQYELCYTNVLNMLDLGGVPLRAADRGENHPLVIAGGPVTCNIEPMADFFDLAVIGEGEEVIGEILDLYGKYKAAGKPDKQAFLMQAAQYDGVYVPAFYDMTYAQDGTIISILPNRSGVPPVVRKRIVRDLDALDLPRHNLVPGTEIVHDRIFLEVFRGCPRGCRFCQAGMIYRPVREFGVPKLAEQARLAEADTGYDEIGLLSLSTSDYSDLKNLTDRLIGDLTPRRTSLSLPSLRLDSFSLELMEKASQTRKSGLTFAPEAGTQRLRDVINKNITEDDLFEAMRLAFRGGWNGAKLYFMLGLPTETTDDVVAIAQLCRGVEDLYRLLPREERPRKLELTVSTALFIPKPFTPFQWVGQPDAATLQERQQLLRGLIKSRNIKYQWHELASSRIEAVLARGDRRLGPVIWSVWQKGQTFDAWDDHFNLANWLDCLAEAGLDPAFYANRERPDDEVFPWSHIDCGVSRAYLLAEYHKALAGETTPQCRVACADCGAACYNAGLCCGQEAAGQKIASQEVASQETAIQAAADPAADVPVNRPDEGSGSGDKSAEAVHPAEPVVLRLRFARREPAIWLAHLDLMRTFERSIRRAGLPVAYSQGYNPRPHLMFALPIGTGLATNDDYVDVSLTSPVDRQEAVDRLNRFLPEGIAILAGQPVGLEKNSLMSRIGAAEYELAGTGLSAAAASLLDLPPDRPWLVLKSGKQPVEIDIRPLVLQWLNTADDRLAVRVKAGSRENLRPDLLLAALVLYGGLDPAAAADASITRLRLLIPADDGSWQSPLPLADER